MYVLATAFNDAKAHDTLVKLQQGYAKLDITTRCTCLESHRGGKATKNIATPLSISHDYSRLEQ